MGSCSSKTTVVQNFVIRIGLLGDAVSGKTAIISRFAHNKFTLNYQHHTKNLAGIKSYLVDETESPVTLEIWEIHSRLNIGIDIAVIVADITMPISQLQDYYWKWLQDANSYGWNDVNVALTKRDLKKDIVDDEYVEKIHESLALSENQQIFLTSSLLGTGIDRMFKTLISHKLRRTSKSVKQPMVLGEAY